MSCFIHKSSEGVAVCKQCGKNMCVECSSMVQHSGLCPSCYKPALIKKIRDLKEEKELIQGKIIGRIFLSVVLCWTIILPLIFILTLPEMFRRRNEEIPAEIQSLRQKIAVVNVALNEGSANI